MSNHLAIAAVTSTLQRLLTAGLQSDAPDITVTARPPDRAPQGIGDSRSQINLFLYQAVPAAALRNMDMPSQVKTGETAALPLALTLRYLLSVYSPGDDEVKGQRIMARAMLILHDHALLNAAEIKAALPGNDLYQQAEPVRLTLDPISLDELHKLWGTFQTQYRLSAAFQASVVLIESRRKLRAPLPVLSRNMGALPGVLPPFPTLASVSPPPRQPSLRLGEALSLTGHDLAGNNVRVRFTHRLWSAPVDVVPGSATPTAISATIPNDANAWPAGTYAVSAAVTHAGAPTRISNELPLSLSPRITSLVVAPSQPKRSATVTVNFTPKAWVEQRVSLLLGEQELLAPARTAPTGTIMFSVADVPPGVYFARLRVDGADSILVNWTGTEPVFDSQQAVTIS